MYGRGRGYHGRGGGSRKPVVTPNLALDGVREPKNRPSTSAKSAKGAKKHDKHEQVRENGRRGGGRGHRGAAAKGREKPVLIEQLGIFSSGLNDDGRHNKPKNEINEFGIVNAGRTKRTLIHDEEDENDVKPITFESEWASDDETEKAELSELLRDNFISDIKQGTVTPLVLPVTESAHFENHMVTSIKKEEVLEEDEVIRSQEAVVPEKKVTPAKNVCEQSSTKLKSEAVDSKINVSIERASLTSSRKAAHLIQRMQQDNDTEILLVYLPSTLASIVNVNTNRRSCGGGEKANGIISNVPRVPKLTDGHCLDYFGDGVRIGKLRIRKSGLLELSAGDITLDVTSAVSSHLQESLVLIETEPTRIVETSASFIIKCEPLLTRTAKNDIFVMGSVRNALVCSHNFPHTVEEMSREREASSRMKKEQKKGSSGTSDERKKLYAALKRLEEKEKRWSRWTRGYTRSMQISRPKLVAWPLGRRARSKVHRHC